MSVRPVGTVSLSLTDCKASAPAFFLFNAVIPNMIAINSSDSAVKNGNNPGAVHTSPGTGRDHEAIMTTMVRMTKKPEAIRSSIGDA